MLQAAILEDNKFLLKELKEMLDDTGLLKVVVWAQNSEEFFEKINNYHIDILILDIDLSGDSMTGLDIANRLQLPVLFVSGKTRDFYAEIEDLNINSNKLVDHLSKPITQEKLNKILPKFINQLKAIEKTEFVYLDFRDTKRNKIKIDTIVFLESNKEYGAESNNKRIYFTDRPPETLIDFSFIKMEEKGFTKTQFITIHKSFRVNTAHIRNYHKDSHEIEVLIVEQNMKEEIKRLPVSVNYWKNIKKMDPC